MTDIEREVLLPATPEEVWDEVADPERLGDWFGADVEGEIAPGEAVRFTSPDGVERRAVVERVERDKRLTFRWLPDADESSSRVDITIHEIPDGSIVRVVERQISTAVSPTPRIGFRALANV